MSNFIATFGPYLLPLLLAVALALAAPIVREGYRILRAARVRVRSRAAQAALDALTVVAGTAVAAAADEVRSLKDPTKPGTWSREVARSIRERVIEEVMRLGRDLIAQLRAIGVLTPDAVYELLERLVEAQVERLRRLDPSSSPTPLLSADLEEPRPTMAPSPLRASTIAVGGAPPPPSQGQRGTVRFGAVAVLLALGLGALALGAVLSGCPKVIREPSLPPPPDGCVAGTTLCHEGAPWRCGPDGHWSQADRRCDRLSGADGGVGVICCATPSALRPGALVHACVPSTVCAPEVSR